MVKLYGSPTCSKCDMLAKKMSMKGIEFEKILDPDEVLAAGCKTIPILEVDGEKLVLDAANKWINSQG